MSLPRIFGVGSTRALPLLVPLCILRSSQESAPSSDQPVLRLVADIPLPGPPGRFDYQSFDPATGRLYIAHMGAGQLLAFDTHRRRLAGKAGDLPKVTGVLAVPELHRVYVSAAGAHQVVGFEDSTLKRIATVGDIVFPDALAYAPVVGKIFVSDEFGRREIVIDAATHARRTIALQGEAGNTQYDSVGRQILVAVQTRNELVAIDPQRERITARHRLAGADHPHGFLVDARRRLAYVSNEGNGKLLVVNLTDGRVLEEQEVGEDPDVLAYDPGLKRLYVAAESGVVTVFSTGGSRLHRLGSYTTPHAHTVAVNPANHEVYLPLANVNGRPVLRILTPAQWWSPRRRVG